MKIRLAITAAALSLVAVAPPAAANAARVDTPPGASYAMSNSCSGSYCTVTITIKSNPDAYNVRAYMVCSTAIEHFGGWHTSGTSTAGCGIGGGFGESAGFEYDKTHQYGVFCWANGDSRTGSC